MSDLKIKINVLVDNDENEERETIIITELDILKLAYEKVSDKYNSGMEGCIFVSIGEISEAT